MPYGFQTPRHLDDPVKLFFGLSIVQLVGTVFALACGAGMFLLLNVLPLKGFAGTEVHIIGSAVVAVPILLVVLIFGGDRIEPLAKQQWGYLRRPHCYAPAPVMPSEQERERQTRAAKTRTRKKGKRRDRVRTAAATLLLPFDGEQGLTINDDGIITLPDGSLRAILRVDGIALECRSPSEQDSLAALFGRLANSLAPGQTLQVLVESQPINAEAAVRDVFRDLRPEVPELREFMALWRPWLERQLRRGHVPNLKFYLVVSPPPARANPLDAGMGIGMGTLHHKRDVQLDLRALEQTIDDTGRHLKRMSLACRRLGRGPALKLLWSCVHAPGTVCPTWEELDQGAEDELEVREQAARERAAAAAARQADVRARVMAIPRAFMGGLTLKKAGLARLLARTFPGRATDKAGLQRRDSAERRRGWTMPRRRAVTGALALDGAAVGVAALQAGHPVEQTRVARRWRSARLGTIRSVPWFSRAGERRKASGDGSANERPVSTATETEMGANAKTNPQKRGRFGPKALVARRSHAAAEPNLKERIARVEAELVRERLCAIEVQESQLRLTVDGALTRSLFILRPPDVTDPGWFDALVGLDCPFRLAIHMEGLDREQERSKLKRKRRQLNVVNISSASSSGIADVDMSSAQREAARLIDTMRSMHHGLVRTGVYLTVLARDAERLNDYASHASSAVVTRLGAELGRGIGYQLPLWQSTLPLGVDAAGRRYRLPSETIGNAFPFLTHSPGMARGYPLGFSAIGNELVLLDPADPGLPNALMNLVGRSGSGKTFLALKLILYTLMLGGRATVVDRAGHYQTLLKVVGGSLAPLGSRENPPALNMWDYSGGIVDGNKIGWIVDAHEIMLAQQAGDHLSAVQRAILEQGVRRVYAAHADGSIPLEHELHAWLEREEKNSSRPASERLLVRELAAGLLPYVKDGRFAPLMDRPTSVDLESRLLVFDIADLGSNQNIQALAMLLIAEAVERRAKRRTLREGADPSRVRELLVIDEGWFLVKYGAGGAWIEQVARQGRHWGLFLCFITQQLSDLVNDPTAASLFNAASCQLLFRQKDEGAGPESGLRWLSKVLALSDEEVRQMQQLSGVRGEYTEMFLIRESKDASTARRGIVRIMAHPAEYWMFSSEPLRDRPQRERMIKACDGDVWAAVKALAEGKEPESIGRESEGAPPLTRVG